MTGPLFPENYSKIWIRGRFITMAGVAVRGKLTLAPTVTNGGLVNRSLKLIMSAAAFSADTDNDGYVALQVPATNDPDITPINFTYAVTTPIGQKFSITVPYDTTVLNSVGDPLHGQPVIELIDVVPVGSSGGVGQLLRGIGIQSIVDNGAGALLITYTDGATSTVAMPSTVVGPTGPAGSQGPLGPAGPTGPAGVLVDGQPADQVNIDSSPVGLADLHDVNTAGAAVGQVVAATAVSGGVPTAWGMTAGISALTADAGPGGTADDTAAAQAALDSGAKVVTFRPGATYTISTDLLPHSGQTIMAHGATIIRKAGNATALNLLNIAGTANNFIEDVHVYGGTWDGNKANVTNVTLQNYPKNNGIRLWWARNCAVVDAVIQNCWGGGIIAGDSIVLGLRVRGCTARYNYDNGIWVRPGCCDVIVSDSSSYGNIFHGIDAIRSDFVTFANCHAWDNGPTQSGEGAGFRLEGVRWSQVSDCTAYSNGGFAGFALTYTSEGLNGWSWKGAYSEATVYAQGDAIQWPPYNGGSSSGESPSWYCIATPPSAAIPPMRNSPYWVQCAFDSNQGANRNNYSVKFSNCRSARNYGVSTRGTWKSGGTYAPYDSVWYMATSTWGMYVCKAAVTGSTTTPNSDLTSWIGPFNPSGFILQDGNHLEMIGCQSDGQYDGVLVHGTVGGAADVRIRDCDFRNNTHNGVNIKTVVAGTQIEIAGSHFDGNLNNAIETATATNALIDVHDNSFSATQYQARALFEAGTSSTVAFRRNKVRGQATEPFSLASATSYVDGTNDMDGKVDHAGGTAAFSASTTATVTFATAFKVAPTAAGINIMPTGAPAGAYYVSAVSATGFTVTCATSGSWGFSWTARNLAP